MCAGVRKRGEGAVRLLEVVPVAFDWMAITQCKHIRRERDKRNFMRPGVRFRERFGAFSALRMGFDFRKLKLRWLRCSLSI